MTCLRVAVTLHIEDGMIVRRSPAWRAVRYRGCLIRGNLYLSPSLPSSCPPSFNTKDSSVLGYCLSDDSYAMPTRRNAFKLDSKPQHDHYRSVRTQ